MPTQQTDKLLSELGIPFDGDVLTYLNAQIQRAVAAERARCAQIARVEAARWRGIPGHWQKAQSAWEIAQAIERGAT